MSIEHVKAIADAVDGKIDSAGILPDGSGFATMSMPLPKDHWSLLDDGEFEPPPMSFPMGTDNPDRRLWVERIRAAAKYAYRASTLNGKEPDLDPDALIQNLIVGMLGYWTPDGLSNDTWANPSTPWQPPEPKNDPRVGGGTNATQARPFSESRVSEHPDRDSLRPTTEASYRNRPPEGGQIS
jgi:hypothetical protein